MLVFLLQLILVIAIFASVYKIYVLYRSITAKKPETSKTAGADFSAMFGENYIRQDDPGGQKMYERKKSMAGPQVEALSSEEEEERSWNFIVEITEMIAQKFSQAEQNLVKELGALLSKLEVRYEHVVKYALRRPKLDKVPEITQNNDIDSAKQKSPLG